MPPLDKGYPEDERYISVKFVGALRKALAQSAGGYVDLLGFSYRNSRTTPETLEEALAKRRATRTETRNIEFVQREHQETLNEWVYYLLDAASRREFELSTGGSPAGFAFVFCMLAFVVTHSNQPDDSKLNPLSPTIRRIYSQVPGGHLYAFKKRMPDTLNTFPPLRPRVVSEVFALIQEFQVWRRAVEAGKSIGQDVPENCRYWIEVMNREFRERIGDGDSHANTLFKALTHNDVGFLYSLIFGEMYWHSRLEFIPGTVRFVRATRDGQDGTYSAREVARASTEHPVEADHCFGALGTALAYLSEGRGGAVGGVLHLLAELGKIDPKTSKPDLGPIHAVIHTEDMRYTQMRGGKVGQAMDPKLAEEVLRYLHNLKEQGYEDVDEAIQQVESLSLSGTIRRKIDAGESLTTDELRSLYTDFTLSIGSDGSVSPLTKLRWERVKNHPEIAKQEYITIFPEYQSEEIAIVPEEMNERTRVYLGHYTFEERHQPFLSNLERIVGDADFHGSVGKVLPRLTEIGGHLYLQGAAGMIMPQLGRIGGGLWLSGSEEASAMFIALPSLRSVGTDIQGILTCFIDLSSLTICGGSMHFNGAKHIALSSLGEIRGVGVFSETSFLDLSSLTTMHGYGFFTDAQNIDLSSFRGNPFTIFSHSHGIDLSAYEVEAYPTPTDRIGFEGTTEIIVSTESAVHIPRKARAADSITARRTLSDALVHLKRIQFMAEWYARVEHAMTQLITESRERPIPESLRDTFSPLIEAWAHLLRGEWLSAEEEINAQQALDNAEEFLRFNVSK